MNFEHSFYQLPFRVDAARIHDEISLRPESEWIEHPNRFKGNSALVLVSVGGGDNNDTHGRMQAADRLHEMPYLRNVLSRLPTVIGRARIMRLAPGCKVNPHTDVSFYWRHRMRLHIPIITDPDVRFFCKQEEVHMAAGELWTFNNWVYHQVHNNSNVTRTHLVIDTVGSPEWWDILENRSYIPGINSPIDPQSLQFIDPEVPQERRIVFENYNIQGVLPPSDVDTIVNEFIDDIDRKTLSDQEFERTQKALKVLQRGWRSIWSVHGDTPDSKKVFRLFLEDIIRIFNSIEPTPHLASNQTEIARALNVQLGETLTENTAGALKPGEHLKET